MLVYLDQSIIRTTDFVKSELFVRTDNISICTQGNDFGVQLLTPVGREGLLSLLKHFPRP